jgi:hypothetical protein
MSESEYQDKPLRSESMGSFSAPAPSKPKKIVRQCPILVDVIIVLVQLGLTVTLGFFSYYYNAIDRPCSAAYGDTFPLTLSGDATIGVDVQRRFTMAIRFGFYLSILNLIRVIVNQVGIWIKNALMYYIAIVMYGINFMLALVWFVFSQMWRWSYDGRVCSGDFLSKADK